MYDVDSAEEHGRSFPDQKVKRIGIIGLGSIGMRHAKNLLAMGHHVFGSDTDELRVNYICESENGHTWMNDNQVDGGIVANPTSDHCDTIWWCGSKLPLLVEKPIAATEEQRQMVARAKNIIMVGYNLRFHSCVKQARDWLLDGAIGKVFWGAFTLGQYSEKPPYLRDGVILNWSHEIDLALYLLGEAEVAESNTRLTDGKDDMTDIILRHSTGCISTVHLDYLTDPEIRCFSISGEKGVIRVDLVKRRAELELTKGGTLIHQNVDTWNDNYIEEMRAFLDRIDGKETLGCTAEEALKVLDICLEVRRQAGLT